MMTRRSRPPDLKIVAVEPAPGRWRQILKSGSEWLFRLALVGLVVSAIAYNQYALSSVVKTVEELKKSLLLKEAEIPIEQTLEKKAAGRLSRLDRIRIARIIAAFETRGFDSHFTLDLIRRESTFRPDAVSPTGAIGLMQLLPSTARWLIEKRGLTWRGDHILFDPVANVALGTEYLAYLADEFRGERRLRTAYQQGPGRARHILRGGNEYAGNP